jgi:hypothetical protein
VATKPGGWLCNPKPLGGGSPVALDKPCEHGCITCMHISCYKQLVLAVPQDLHRAAEAGLVNGDARLWPARRLLAWLQVRDRQVVLQQDKNRLLD